jgi:autotransporter-associated beta strand protein
VFNFGSYLQTSAGLVKADGGAVSINAPQYFTGTTTVNGGLLSIGAQNALTVLPSSTVPTLLSLVLNGGGVDLNGYTQAVAGFTNNNTLAGSGGNVTSSVAGGTLISATGNCRDI